jgi:hypothetical protein
METKRPPLPPFTTIEKCRAEGSPRRGRLEQLRSGARTSAQDMASALAGLKARPTVEFHYELTREG